ncbi:MAG: Fic family protein [Myxococcota bacterium]
MTYQRIRGFSEHLNDFYSPELEALGVIWKEKKSELQESGTFKKFLLKLQREWAIETGLIERLYTWDRGVTEVLIEQGVEATIIAHQSGIQRDQATHIKRMIDDQISIIEGLFSFVKVKDPVYKHLSEHFIRSIHQQFTNNQNYTEALTSDGKITTIPLEKGVYKKHPNNPKRPDGELHIYCPPELTQEEMEQLIRWYKENEDKYRPEVKAAWLHHRFTQVHPFQDGNGRVARALASLVFLREGYFPLVVRSSDRDNYMEALEKADQGRLAPLITFFAERQKQTVLQALRLEQ